MTLRSMPRACAALLALLGGYAFAGTTASVSLSGEVTTILAITSTPTAGASALDLDGEGSSAEHIVQVSDLAITTNNEQGFALSITSGNLTKTGGTSIAFLAMTVDDGGDAPLTGDGGWATGAYTTVAAGPVSRDLYIKYDPADLQDPGSYAGTVGLTVSDNP